MNSIFLIILFSSFFLMAFAFFWFSRAQQNQSQTGFKRLLENLEELQRSQELKNSLIRTELSEALKTNRQEMQSSLFQASQNLDNKVSLMEKKLEEKLGSLTQNVGEKLELNLKE